MLDPLYVEGVGIADGNLDLDPLVKQLAHRYPRMKVLEVRAGTGAGFFELAKAKFSQHAAKMSFKLLSIEKDSVDQGFDDGGA
ncbi:hypothetical protein BDW68DRAFT_178642 [Aspergillus falconensis]